MRRVLLAAGVAVAASVGCANTVPIPKASLETLLFTLSTRGPLDVSSGNVRYYLVLDTTPDPSIGPRCYGPARRFAPVPGWDLPFAANPFSVPGTVPPLLDVEWTDYYAVTSSGGVLAITHGQQTGNIKNGLGNSAGNSTVNPQVGNLVQGIDWDRPDANSIRFIIQASNLSYPVPPTTTGTFPNPLKFELVTTNSQGQIVDLWDQANFNSWQTVPTTIGSITPRVNPFSNLAQPAALPAGTSADSAGLKTYQAEIKS